MAPGRRGDHHRRLALRLAVEQDRRAEQVLVGVGPHVDLRRIELLDQRDEHLLRLADARHLERPRRRIVSGRLDDHRVVAVVELALPRRHADGRACLVIDVDGGALRRRVDLHRESAGLVPRAVRLRVRGAREHSEQQQRQRPDPHDTRTSNRHRVPSMDGRQERTSNCRDGAPPRACFHTGWHVPPGHHGLISRAPSAPSSARPATIRYTAKPISWCEPSQRRNQAIDAYPTTVATPVPTASAGMASLPSAANALRASRMPAPAIAGIDSRNENRAASLRVNPSSSAMQIVAPDRDTPGTSAMVCARPISSASLSVIVASSRPSRPAAWRSMSAMITPTTISAVAITYSCLLYTSPS